MWVKGQVGEGQSADGHSTGTTHSVGFIKKFLSHPDRLEWGNIGGAECLQ